MSSSRWGNHRAERGVLCSRSHHVPGRQERSGTAKEKQNETQQKETGRCPPRAAVSEEPRGPKAHSSLTCSSSQIIVPRQASAHDLPQPLQQFLISLNCLAQQPGLTPAPASWLLGSWGRVPQALSVDGLEFLSAAEEAAGPRSEDLPPPCPAVPCALCPARSGLLGGT